MENLRAENIEFLYYLNRTRPNASGECPITLRLSVGDTETTLSVKQHIHPTHWQDGYPVGKTEPIKAVKFALDTLRVKLTELYRRLALTENPTAETLKNAYLGKGQAKNTRSIVALFSALVDEYQALKKAGHISPSTYTKWNSTLTHLKAFVQWQYHCEDLPLSKVDKTFVSRMEHYLRVETPNQHNQVKKHLQRVKHVTDEAFHNGWITADPYWKYDLSQEKIDKGYLTESELEKIIKVKLDDPALKHVRDLFVFSCFTGLAYGDVKNFSRKDLEQDHEQTWWIRSNRIKSNVRASIRMLPQALQLLKKLRPDFEQQAYTQALFPIRDNSTVNKLVRKVAKAAGVEKYVTYHLARHSFATTVALTYGLPMESLQVAMGHEHIGTTELYGKILEQKVGKDMKQLTAEIERIPAFQLVD